MGTTASVGPGGRNGTRRKHRWVIPLPRRAKLVSAGGGGCPLPRPSTEKSAPRDSKRSGLVPGLGTAWPRRNSFFFQRTKVLRNLKFHLRDFFKRLNCHPPCLLHFSKKTRGAHAWKSPQRPGTARRFSKPRGGGHSMDGAGPQASASLCGTFLGSPKKRRTRPGAFANRAAVPGLFQVFH